MGQIYAFYIGEHIRPHKRQAPSKTKENADFRLILRSKPYIQAFQPKLAMNPERILRKTRDLLDYYSRSVPKMQELALKKRCLRLSKIRPRRQRRDGLYKTPCAALQYAPVHWNRCFLAFLILLLILGIKIDR